MTITITFGDRQDVLTLTEPVERCRSDQSALSINGVPQPVLSNRTAVGRLVASMLPRWASKRQQHESDMINEDWL